MTDIFQWTTLFLPPISAAVAWVAGRRRRTRDNLEALKFSGYGKDSRMVIISPYKIKTIKNPSGFDITSSFSVEQDFLSRGDGGAMPTTWPQQVVDAYSMAEVYCYMSNVTNQSKAYPLTVTFE